jgi:hypothetical protein
MRGYNLIFYNQISNDINIYVLSSATNLAFTRFYVIHHLQKNIR